MESSWQMVTGGPKPMFHLDPGRADQWRKYRESPQPSSAQHNIRVCSELGSQCPSSVPSPRKLSIWFKFDHQRWCISGRTFEPCCCCSFRQLATPWDKQVNIQRRLGYTAGQHDNLYASVSKATIMLFGLLIYSTAAKRCHDNDHCH
jgi:hypothetical protein